MRNGCPNCGAVLYLAPKKCPYCLTRLEPPGPVSKEPDSPEIMAIMERELLSPNELRGLLGLPQAKEAKG